MDRGGMDGAGRAERWIRRAYRWRSWLLCRLGKHYWGMRRNPEIGGKDALYELCRRCGRERQGYYPPPPGAIWGGR